MPLLSFNAIEVTKQFTLGRGISNISSLEDFSCDAEVIRGVCWANFYWCWSRTTSGNVLNSCHYDVCSHCSSSLSNLLPVYLTFKSKSWSSRAILVSFLESSTQFFLTQTHCNLATTLAQYPGNTYMLLLQTHCCECMLISAWILGECSSCPLLWVVILTSHSMGQAWAPCSLVQWFVKVQQTLASHIGVEAHLSTVGTLEESSVVVPA